MKIFTKFVWTAYTSFLLSLIILSTICNTAAQDKVNCTTRCATMTPDCIDCKIENIDYEEQFDKIKDDIEFGDIIEDYINDVGIKKLVEDHLPMSFAGLIVVCIIILTLPSLIIIGLLFTCCWAFNICCFSKKYARLHEDRSYTKQSAPVQFTQVPTPSPMTGGLVRSRSFSSSPSAPAGPVPNNNMIPRFATKKPATPPQQYGSYDDFNSSATAWQNRTNGHSNPNYQQQGWRDY